MSKTNIDYPKEKKEREVFKKFAIKASSYLGDLKWVENRKPPEPDLLCCFSEGKKIAFELVEFIHPDFVKQMFRLTSLRNKLSLQFKKILSEKSLKLKEELRDREIGVIFKDENNISVRNASSLILNYLIRLSGIPEGKCKIDSFSPIGKIISHMFIEKISFLTDGPRFYIQPQARGYPPPWDKPPVDRIKEKFRKRYETQHDIELLCYYRTNFGLDHKEFHRSLSFEKNKELDDAKECIKSEIQKSIFKRVWIYRCTGDEDKIIFVHNKE